MSAFLRRFALFNRCYNLFEPFGKSPAGLAFSAFETKTAFCRKLE
jgi:hypothetical protein